jgi:pimeloyl-ACP methyl ester carboxylesterase
MRVEVNGTKLFVDVDGAGLVTEGGVMRERPTVLLLHGGPGFDHSNFKPEYAQLTDVAQLVYVDHRGNGRSDRGDPSSWNFDSWADDVKGLCDALEIEHPVVLGWSFGGMVAMAYAARYPEHPAKLILQSTAAQMDPARIAASFKAIGGSAAGDAARDFWEVHDGTTMGPYLEHCLPLYHSGPTDEQLTRCVLNLDLLANGFEGWKEMDLRAGLSQVRVPVLVLVGRQDPITPPLEAEEIAAALGGADVALELFEHSSHFIHLAEPDRFFSVVRSFITA